MDSQALEVVLPWSLVEIDSGDHVYIVDHEDAQVVRFHKTQSEVAKRVVACVNACRGISTEELLTSDFGEDSVEVGTLLGQTMQQRDELLHALQQMAAAFFVRETQWKGTEIYEIAQTAISNACGSVLTDSDGGHCD